MYWELIKKMIRPMIYKPKSIGFKQQSVVEGQKNEEKSNEHCSNGYTCAYVRGSKAINY